MQKEKNIQLVIIIKNFKIKQLNPITAIPLVLNGYLSFNSWLLSKIVYVNFHFRYLGQKSDGK